MRRPLRGWARARRDPITSDRGPRYSPRVTSPRHHRLVYPAADRNGAPIQRVLERVLSKPARVLEIGSGSGQHGARFAAAFPRLVWCPSDPDARCRRSIEAYRTEVGLPNLEPVRTIDVHSDGWGVETVDAIFCANMIHVAPWSACLGLVAGAKRHLGTPGTLVLYGPFRRDGAHTSEGNARFDASLRVQDPSWGVRDLEDVVQLAAPDLALDEVVEMPANNLSVILRRA